MATRTVASGFNGSKKLLSSSKSRHLWLSQSFDPTHREGDDTDHYG
jgi:hypothetical protein